MNQHQSQDEYIEILEARCDELESQNDVLMSAITAIYNAVRMQSASLNGCVHGILTEILEEANDDDDGESDPLSHIVHAPIQ